MIPLPRAIFAVAASSRSAGQPFIFMHELCKIEYRKWHPARLGGRVITRP
jgi:hypothetical protein